jgi:CRISPR/Cas system Type II protein with McrA/HNH and RuvC-like nuclease domain
MQTDDDMNLLLSRVRYPESLQLQLVAFQKHLAEVETAIEFLSKYYPSELDSYKLIEKLLIVKIAQLKRRMLKSE